MKRQIKFRAWDKEKKNMLYPGHIDCSNNISCGGYKDKWYACQWGIICHAIQKMQEDFIPMQFTGLKDKNGRDVYEGDIIEYFEWFYASKRSSEPTKIREFYDGREPSYLLPLVGVVKWNEKCCTYEPLISSPDDYNNNSFAYVCEPNGKRAKGTDFRAKDTDFPPSYYEVIGNIYENPELL